MADDMPRAQIHFDMDPNDEDRAVVYEVVDGEMREVVSIDVSSPVGTTLAAVLYEAVIAYTKMYGGVVHEVDTLN